MKAAPTAATASTPCAASSPAGPSSAASPSPSAPESTGPIAPPGPAVTGTSAGSGSSDNSAATIGMPRHQPAQPRRRRSEPTMRHQPERPASNATPAAPRRSRGPAAGCRNDGAGRPARFVVTRRRHVDEGRPGCGAQRYHRVTAQHHQQAAHLHRTPAQHGAHGGRGETPPNRWWRGGTGGRHRSVWRGASGHGFRFRRQCYTGRCWGCIAFAPCPAQRRPRSVSAAPRHPVSPPAGPAVPAAR